MNLGTLMMNKSMAKKMKNRNMVHKKKIMIMMSR